jgi:hypothetical protein
MFGQLAVATLASVGGGWLTYLVCKHGWAWVRDKL